MKWVKDKDGNSHVELTAKEARQGGRGRPALYILIALMAVAAMIFGVSGYLIG